MWQIISGIWSTVKEGVSIFAPEESNPTATTDFSGIGFSGGPAPAPAPAVTIQPVQPSAPAIPTWAIIAGGLAAAWFLLGD